MANFSATLSDNVRDFMRIHKLTQEQLAIFLRITQSALAQKLAGRRPWNLSDIERLADYGVDIPPFDIGRPVPVDSEERALF